MTTGTDDADRAPSQGPPMVRLFARYSDASRPPDAAAMIALGRRFATASEPDVPPETDSDSGPGDGGPGAGPVLPYARP